MNTDILAVGASNRIFIIGFYNKRNFQKNKVSSGKTPFLVVGPRCMPQSICLTIGFWQGSFIWKSCVFNFSILK